MWKREESGKSLTPPQTNDGGPSTKVPTAAMRTNGRETVTIGKSIVIKGQVSGSENLTIEGNVDGKIELKQHLLTIGSHGRIRAEVFAKSVVVLGEVVGNIKATEKVAIRDDGKVEGDIVAPRVAIAEGAQFRGGIDMQQRSPSKVEEKSASEGRKGQPSKGKGSSITASVGGDRA